MLNYMKADLYRTATRISFYIWLLALTALPVLAIAGAKTAYAPEMIIAVTPSIVYVALSLVALIVSDYAFREDMQLGLYKNDTTSGVSRTGIYVAKFLTGVLLMAGMWLCCSASCILTAGFSFGWSRGIVLLGNMTSMTVLVWFLQTIMCLSLLQAISVLVKKTAALLGICVLISAVLTNAGNVVSSIFPGVANFFNVGGIPDSLGNPSFAASLKFLTMPVIGIALLLFIGNMLFGRKEL
jgi:hypothetical protein